MNGFWKNSGSHGIIHDRISNCSKARPKYFSLLGYRRGARSLKSRLGAHSSFVMLQVPQVSQVQSYDHRTWDSRKGIITSRTLMGGIKN